MIINEDTNHFHDFRSYKMSFRRLGFTLIELLIAMTIFSMVMIIVIQFYLSLIRVKRGLEGKQLLIETSYTMLEKIQTEMKDYTIDYEEYFNRRAMGCDTIPTASLANFERNVGSGGNKGSCDRFTQYGNSNGFLPGNSSGNHQLYFCSSSILADETKPKVYKVPSPIGFINGSGCFETPNLRPLSFGQYRMQFLDVRSDADTVPGSFGDDDDFDMGKGPQAIGAPSSVQELYLINKYNDKRLFIRRSFLTGHDIDGDGLATKDFENLYTLQMLRLRGFDVGDDHSLGGPTDPNDTSTGGQYDGLMDTRACDATEGFICTGKNLGGAYNEFTLPASENDGRVRMFSNNITVPERNIEMSPATNPVNDFANESNQIAPFFRLIMQTKLYGDFWYTSIGKSTIDNYAMSVQTTFTINQFQEDKQVVIPSP